jgi:hypothetical protein
VNFLIADTFMASFNRLSGLDQKAVKASVFDLQVARAGNGLQFHVVVLVAYIGHQHAHLAAPLLRLGTRSRADNERVGPCLQKLRRDRTDTSGSAEDEDPIDTSRQAVLVAEDRLPGRRRPDRKARCILARELFRDHRNDTMIDRDALRPAAI